MGGLDGALNDQAEAGIMKESERKNDRRTLRFNWSMAADGCLSLFLPVKWEFFLPNIVKCLLKGGPSIVWAFGLLLYGLHLTI